MIWILSLLLVLSVTGLILLTWYIMRLLQSFRYISNNSSQLLQIVGTYREHLQKVYELPMFYGDETLRSLLSHTNDLSKDLEDLSQVFFLEDENRRDFTDEETEG
jgi:C4-dicarboxylate-specific signal transduction histidine kinase